MMKNRCCVGYCLCIACCLDVTFCRRGWVNCILFSCGMSKDEEFMPRQRIKADRERLPVIKGNAKHTNRIKKGRERTINCFVGDEWMRFLLLGKQVRVVDQRGCRRGFCWRAFVKELLFPVVASSSRFEAEGDPAWCFIRLAWCRCFFGWVLGRGTFLGVWLRVLNDARQELFSR